MLSVNFSNVNFSTYETAPAIRRAIMAVFFCALLWAPEARAQRATASSAELTARSFFAALVRGQVDTMSALCADTVNFDGRTITGRDALVKQLQRIGKRAQSKLLSVVSVHVLSYHEMIRGFGNPPQRLRSAIKSRDRVALAVLKHGGIIAVLSPVGQLWQISALTD